MTDDELFEKVLCNPHHVLYNSLPNQIVSFYELRLDHTTDK